MYQRKPSVVITLTWNDTRKLWDILASWRSTGTAVSSRVVSGKAYTTIEIDRDDLRGLVQVLVLELERRLL